MAGVRSSLLFLFVREGIRETCESVFPALAGDRTRDGIFDISLLLPERDRVPSIELFNGDLLNGLEVKLLLLDDLLISLSKSSLLTVGELVLSWPLGRTMSLFSRFTLGGARRLVTSLCSRRRPAGDCGRGLTKLLSCLRLEEDTDRAGLGIGVLLAGDCVRRGLTISLFSRRRLPFFNGSWAGWLD